jgi:hypothetical protein
MRCLLLLLLASFASNALAQPRADVLTSPYDVATEVTESARFVIVQSPVKLRTASEILAYTFRLDRRTGETKILAVTRGTTEWRDVQHLGLESRPRRYASGINYQMFLSGSSLSHTYLMDVNTGALWQLISADASNTLQMWQPVR